MQLHLALTFAFVLIVGMIFILGMKNAPARAGLEHTEAPSIALPTLGASTSLRDRHCSFSGRGCGHRLVSHLTCATSFAG